MIIASLGAPVLVSRLGARRVLITSLAALAVLTAASIRFTEAWLWFVARFLVGFALNGTYTAATTMLANFLPAAVRARLMAIYMAMFSVALMSAGVIGGAAGAGGWRVLILVGAGLPALAGLAALSLPDDRCYAAFADDTAAQPHGHGQWSAMIAGRRWRLTAACVLLAGMNFSAYQFYSGFITTYLTTVRHFSASVTGLFVTVDGVGTLIGSLLWGAVADRLGRRAAAIGFVLAAGFTIAFLVAPVAQPVLIAIELGYAICLSCTNIWPALFAELFPVQLRPMGTALFHGGHIVSLFAPVVVTIVAAHASLAAGMALAPLTFLAAAVLWWTLPETLRTSRLYRGFTPGGAAAAAV